MKIDELNENQAPEANKEGETGDFETLKNEMKNKRKDPAEKAEAPKNDVPEVPEKTPEDHLEERVTVQLFKGGEFKDDVFVSVNGEGIMIQRGIPVSIKRKHALVLESQYSQQLIVQKLQEEYAKQE